VVADPSPGGGSAALVELRGITKRFPGGTLANNAIDLELRRGEILALLGENGAGKSTLMSILYGLYRPDAGEIRLRGQAVRFRSAHDAIRHGLGMVHQDFMLVPTLTVAENLMLGQPSSRAPLLADRRAVAARITELALRHGLAVDPLARVDSLSVGQQQRVEILKALYRGADILILDEPTAVLTPQEVDELLAVLRALAADGRSIVFISHKLDEALRLADRIAVLRSGRLVATVLPGETDARALGRLMIGRDLGRVVATHAAGQPEPRLVLRDVEVADDRGLPALRDIDLVVHAGEIVGIAGVDGNGQRELEEVVTGLRPPRSGGILLAGRDVTAAPPGQRLDSGLGYVASDRYGRALLRDFAVADNLVLESFHRPPFSRAGILDRAAIERYARRLVEVYGIRAASIRTPAGGLSGGNAQKLVLARALSQEPAVLLVCQPTRGVDVGAIEQVHGELLRRRDAGMAILLISTDLDEVLALSDRILVLSAGRIAGERPAGAAHAEELGLMMGGRHEAPAHVA
jgi:general nucleoside transport system ATP-binding protein